MTSNGVPSGSVQSVTRALAALELVAASRRGVTARELARHLGIALPSAYHLLVTLTDAGYLLHLAGEHRYALGYRVRLLEQGLERQMEVPGLVAEAIRRLHLEADAAAYYAVYREVDVVQGQLVTEGLGQPGGRHDHAGPVLSRTCSVGRRPMSR